MFFEIIFKLLAVIETPIFLFQSLVKQMPPDHLIYTVINVKRNNLINSGQMSRRYFYFILFSFDQNLNSPKYGA